MIIIVTAGVEHSITQQEGHCLQDLKKSENIVITIEAGVNFLGEQFPLTENVERRSEKLPLISKESRQFSKRVKSN